jgi:hypothetical protein
VPADATRCRACTSMLDALDATNGAEGSAI